MWAAVCLVALAWAPPPVHPAVRKAFGRQDVRHAGVLDARQMRRALRELGVDVNRPTAGRLIDLYAPESNASVDVDALAAIVDTAAVASPARFFWLALDPDGRGPRATRPAWNRFGRAGLRTPARMAHYGIGLASILVGAADMVGYVSHGGIPEMASTTAFAHGVIHTAAACTSLPRFQYKWNPDAPFHLWMPTSREANMYPAAVQYVWYTLAMMSTFVQPAGAAWFRCDAPGFVALSWFVVATLLYSTSRTILERENMAGVYTSHVSNVLQVVWAMALPVMADVGKCILVAHDPHIHDAYAALVAAYPEYTQIYQGSLLGGMFAGNVACALSSAEHHRAVTKEQIGDLSNALVALFAAAAFVGIFRVHGGDLAWGMLLTTWQGALSFV